MESLTYDNDIQRCHYQATITDHQLETQALSASHQGLLDRQAFLWHMAAQTAEVPPYTPPTLPIVEAEQLVRDIVAKDDFAPHYQWLAQADTAIVARVMRDVTLFRQEWAVGHTDEPSTLRIYRQFRLMLEQDESDEYTHQAVTIFEALTNGDFSTGTLPF